MTTNQDDHQKDWCAVEYGSGRGAEKFGEIDLPLTGKRVVDFRVVTKTCCVPYSPLLEELITVPEFLAALCKEGKINRA